MSDTTSRETARTVPLYFGCWDGVGHGFHYTSGRSADYRSPDGRLAFDKPPTPWGYGVERLSPHGSEQGVGLLHHKDGWTALAVDDFTVDSRGNSKSVFCEPAILTWEEAIAAAREHFPRIAQRVGSMVHSGSRAR